MHQEIYSASYDVLLSLKKNKSNHSTSIKCLDLINSLQEIQGTKEQIKQYHIKSNRSWVPARIYGFSIHVANQSQELISQRCFKGFLEKC